MLPGSSPLPRRSEKCARPGASPPAWPGSMLHDTISTCDNLTAAETAFQRRSHVETILNVPQRVRLRLFLPCGLAGRLFEQPVTQPERHCKAPLELEKDSHPRI